MKNYIYNVSDGTLLSPPPPHADKTMSRAVCDATMTGSAGCPGDISLHLSEKKELSSA